MNAFGPSVLDGKLRYLSTSQLEKFDPESYGGCNRRWWFRYVERKPEPQIRSQKLGTQMHEQIEHYLLTGEDVLGEIARSGKRFIPEPGPDLLVEYAFGEAFELFPGGGHGPIVSPLDAGGVPFVGFSDLINGRGDDEADIEVLDWKSTKLIFDEVIEATGLVKKQGYAKSADAMANTWQMRGYGELVRRMGAKRIRLSHVYFQTQGQRVADKRTKIVTAGTCQAHWSEADELVEKMQGVARLKVIADVKPNYAACSAYGGCPFKAECPRDVMAVIGNLFKPTQMRAEKVTNDNMNPLMEKLKAKQAGQTNGAVAQDATVTAEIEKLKTEEAARATTANVAATTGVLAPDAPSQAQDTTASVAATIAADPPKAAEKKTRAKKSPPPDESAVDGISLYLAPARERGVTLKSLDSYASGIADKIAEAYKVDDIRSPSNEAADLTFGKWEGVLASFVKKYPPETGAYECLGSRFGRIAFDALEPTATRVVYV